MEDSWRSCSAEELEWQYNPRITVPDFADYMAEFAALSDVARKTLHHLSDIRYGRGEKETLDFFPAAEDNAPIHVFFHGGYWRSQDKQDYAFVATSLVPRGFSVAIVNYDLCPDVTVEDILHESMRSLQFLRTNAVRLGSSPDGMTLSGHSAGGQIVAKLAARSRYRDSGMENPIAGIVAISGVFDLRPLRRTTINADIRLSQASAELNSLDRDSPAPGTSLLVAVGSDETPEFIGQSSRYAARHSASVELVPGSHHFSVLGNVFLVDGNRHAELLAFLCAAAKSGK